VAMFAAVSQTWKLLLTMTLLGAILCSVTLRAPRQPTDRAELRRLVVAAVILYSVGTLASLSHHGLLAGTIYAGGILVCSLAVWLSRGMRRDDGSDGSGGGGGGNGKGPPGSGRPPSGPDGLLPFDWDEFERELSAWSERSKIGV
jgi:hypothetical protein